MCTICGTSSYTAAIQLFIFISNIGAAGSEAAIGVLYAMSFYSKNGPKCKCEIRYKLFSFICSSIKASKHKTNHFFQIYLLATFNYFTDVLPLLIFIMAIFFANAAGSVLVANRL